MRISVGRADMKALDNLAVRRFHYSIEQMMELAGFQLATFVSQRLDKKSRVLVASGSGNNGGGGFVAARHLTNWGFNTTVYLAGRRVYKSAPKRMLETLLVSDCKLLLDEAEIGSYTTILDCLIGYGLKGQVKSSKQQIFKNINDSKSKIVSFDVPSGLDVDTGEPMPSAVRADYTLVLAANKKGLIKDKARKFTGRQALVDIGIPRAAYKTLNLVYPF